MTVIASLGALIVHSLELGDVYLGPEEARRAHASDPGLIGGNWALPGRLVLLEAGQLTILYDEFDALVTQACLVAPQELAAGRPYRWWMNDSPAEVTMTLEERARIRVATTGTPTLRVPTFEADAPALLSALVEAGQQGVALVRDLAVGDAERQAVAEEMAGWLAQAQRAVAH